MYFIYNFYMSKNKKKIIKRGKELKRYFLHSNFDTLFSFNKEKFLIRELTKKEINCKNITYIGIRLGLERTDIAFWNDNDEISDNDEEKFDHITKKNFHYNRYDLTPNSNYYEHIKSYLKQNIPANSISRVVIELPSFNPQSNELKEIGPNLNIHLFEKKLRPLLEKKEKEKLTIIPVLETFKKMFNEINTNNEIKVINFGIWKMYYPSHYNTWWDEQGFDEESLIRKQETEKIAKDLTDIKNVNEAETVLIANSIDQIWINPWNPFFEYQKRFSKWCYKNIAFPTKVEIDNLLSLNYKDYFQEEEYKNITYIGIDLGLKRTGIAIWNHRTDKPKYKKIESTNFIHNDLKKELNPKNYTYRKIEDFLKENIDPESSVKVIIETSKFKENKEDELNRKIILKFFKELLNKINLNNKIKSIPASNWRKYYEKYDLFFNNSDYDPNFPKNRKKLKQIAQDITNIENDDEAEAWLIVNEAENIWKDLKNKKPKGNSNRKSIIVRKTRNIINYEDDIIF